MSNSPSDLKIQLKRRISKAQPAKVWTPADFFDLGNRDAVDKTLQRLATKGELRRIDRGLYDLPRLNALSGKSAVPDYRSVIDAVGRRDQVRVLIDGMTAANDLGLTNAVPGQVTVHTDGRLRPISLNKLVIRFKLTAPSKLYWAGRPAVRVVQALYWLRDGLKGGDQVDQARVRTKLSRLLWEPQHGRRIREDLSLGLRTVPVWMQQWIRELLERPQRKSAEVNA